MASSCDLKDQIESLQKHIQSIESKNIKILNNIGEYSYVIKFSQFNEYDLNLTIQIPIEIINSNIILHKYGNSQKNSENKIERIQLELQHYFKNLNKSNNWLIDFYLKASEIIQQNFESRKATKSNEATKKEKIEHKNDSDSDQEQTKKSSMKTSEDVINRIFWDQEINKEFITVGYLDRFLGIKEVLFNLFDWGDIVEADMNALAIPKHRIHYFKYKNEIIWNKNTRLDNVFGSTGSNITIHDVIKRLDDINFNILESIEDEKPNKTGRAKAVNNTNSPNYFISLPIKNAKLKENLFNLTNDLADSNQNISKYLIPDTSYHITLCTLRCDSDEELETVKNVMEIFFEDETLIEDYFPIDLKFDSIGEFYNKVLFIKCNCDKIESLEAVKRKLLDKLESVFVNTAGNYYDFIPHLTIFKINKSTKETNTDSVDSLVNKYVWNKYENKQFGNQSINEIHLCKMGNIQELKAYPIEHTVKIGIK